MANKSNKQNERSSYNVLKLKSKKLVLLAVTLLLGIILAGATVYGVMPKISLNSPTSFPVDI